MTPVVNCFNQAVCLTESSNDEPIGHAIVPATAEAAKFQLRDRHKLAFDWLPNDCERVLDGGCAFGYGTAPLAAKAKTVFGCDPSPELIASAKKNCPGIQFEICPLEKTPYADKNFDAIVLTDVLEHVADEKATLDELFRVLKPGGRLIITTPHKDFSDLWIRTITPGICGRNCRGCIAGCSG